MKTFFVSSTFKDMHFERDAIREITLPRLNAFAREYGESVSFCDLRWGIDTSEMSEEVSSGKVIRVCLDEIDRCKPPLVVILGERYGWIPDKDLVRGVLEYKHFSIEDMEKSVTALEIEYGAMTPDRRFEHTLVYFRHLDNPPEDYMAEDEEHKRKLDELKARVAALPNATVKEYTAHWNGSELLGVREFATMLSDDLYAIMRPEWEKNAVEMLGEGRFSRAVMTQNGDEASARYFKVDTLENVGNAIVCFIRKFKIYSFYMIGQGRALLLVFCNRRTAAGKIKTC